MRGKKLKRAQRDNSRSFKDRNKVVAGEGSGVREGIFFFKVEEITVRCVLVGVIKRSFFMYKKG